MFSRQKFEIHCPACGHMTWMPAAWVKVSKEMICEACHARSSMDLSALASDIAAAEERLACIRSSIHDDFTPPPRGRRLPRRETC